MTQKPEKQKCLAVVRIRGTIDASREVRDTLKMLNLARNCYATLIDDRPSYLGMLQMVQSYVTWGEVSKESIYLLLKRRGRLIGDKKLTDECAQKVGHNSLEDLADGIHQLKVEFNHLPGIKPVFRLHPPSKGFKGKIKRSYASGGESGYRKEAINDLIKRMA